MAASPPSSSAFPPVSSSASPPPPFISPPFSAPRGDSQPNASSGPPTFSPPPVINATPPSSSNLTPPLSSSSPPSPPTVPSPPPLSNPSPPPASSSPPTPPAPPPAPTLSSPPTLTPPLVSEPPPPLILSPPPTLLSPPPVVFVPPPSPSQAQPPPSSTPLGDLSSPPPSFKPPPPSSTPLGDLSSPPPSFKPPPPSFESPPPSRQSPPPLESPSPPLNSNPSETPPKESPPTPPSPPFLPPSNSSNHNSSANPHVPPTPPSSFPIPPSNSPGLPSGGPPGFPSNPIGPSSGRSGTPSSNDIISPGSSRATGGGSKTGVFSPIVIVLTLVAFSVIGILVLLIIKRKKQGQYASGFVMPSPQGSSQFSESSDPRSPTAPLVYYSSGTQGGTPGSKNSQPEPSLGNSKSWFSFEELYHITNGFSEHNLLGEGGFGCVYKGCLPNGREVAVKQLKVGGAQGEREFKAEVEIISRVHHRHLVSLVGHCIAENQRLLVYDYVPNDTLHYHLHGQGKSIMDWALRVKVAAGAARGIAYLHEDCHPRIIHRDIKSSNILLDNNFEAQVSDFGLARLAMDAYTHVTTRVMGTFGYLAPEYASTGKLTEKSDVFSFGVVLLELISGRKPVDSSQPIGDESLVEWARPLLSSALESGDFGALPDSKLASNYNAKEMLRMMEAAAACVRHSASMRPRMSLVVRALDSLSDIDLSNGLQPGQSELFNTGPQSEEIRMFQRMAFGSQTFFNTEFT